jgi:hypothetical protein
MAGMRRRARHFYGDVRFFVGIALIAASVGGVWLTVHAASATEPYLVAARTVVAGDPLTAESAGWTEIALGAADPGYVRGPQLPDGVVLDRTVERGELIPASALVDEATLTTTTVVVQSSTAVSSSVVAGSSVELWAAPPTERGLFAAPEVIVPRAVVRTLRAEGSIVGSDVTSIELVVARSVVPAVLTAVAAGSALSVVSVTAP